MYKCDKCNALGVEPNFWHMCTTSIGQARPTPPIIKPWMIGRKWSK